MGELTSDFAPSDCSELLRHGDGGPLPAGGLRLFQHRFEEFAATRPEAPALLCGDVELTYGELDARANRLARALRAREVQPEVVVGVCLPRGVDAIVAVLGILKAGGAYLWLEPSHPYERRRFMLEDAGASVLITLTSLATGLEDLPLDILTPGQVSDEDDASPPSWPAPTLDGLAYVMYTSGSTGRPKGVMIEHHCLSSFVEWGRLTFSDEELSGVLLATSLGFDASIFELFVPLGCGGKIVMIENLFAIDNTPAGQIKLINSVPSLMAALLNDRPLPDSVRTVILVGELLPPELAEQLYAQPHLERLVNAYGPTEDTCFSTWEDVPRDRPPTIGRPLPGTQVYILDENLQLAAPGAVGELCLGGAGLARGYRNREELTRKKFIANAFPDTPSDRLYRTGDLARWEPDGNLQHLGRVDHQIKVRGVRIEPAEIETALTSRDDVRQSVVIARARPDGQRQLVAYLVCENGASAPTAQALREWLRKRLPEPMVPSAFVTLDELPLNANGKLDRDRLPEPAAQPADVATLTKTERTLAELWSEVLGLEWPPGPEDDFFDLGGQSLIAYKLFAIMRERLGTNLSPAVLVEASTVRALAARVDSGAVENRRWARVHPEGRRVPWIYIHPGAGGMLTLHNFGRAVTGDQPIYGLQAFPDRDEVGDVIPSVPEAAERCLAELRRLQPEGPYVVTGHSIGGHVAFHIACTLQEAGEEILFLGLLDPVAPHLLRFGGRVIARGKEVVGIGPEGRRRGIVQAGIKVAKNEARSRFRRRPAPGVEEAVDDADDRSWERSLIVREGEYRPRTFQGPVTVFQTGKTARYAGTTTLGWKRYVRGSLEVVRVPGEHISILLDPHVHVLAAEISTRLDALYPAQA